MSGTERAVAAVDAVRALLAEARAHLALASIDEVADLLARTAELTRLMDGLQVRVAAEVAERSQRPVDESLCRILGDRSAKELLARAFGVRGRQASELLAVAAATSASLGLTGATVPARFPRVGRALASGAVSLEQAQAIVQVLEPAASRAAPDDLEWAESALVDAATDQDAPLVPELLTVQGRTYAAVLDPDGVLPDAERQRAMRSLNLWRRRDGTWKMTLVSPPEDGAAIKALLDAYTGPRVRFGLGADDAETAGRGRSAADEAGQAGDEAGQAGDEAGQAGDEAEASVEDRTLPQRRHDVLLGLVRAHAASGDAPTVGGEAPVLVLTGTIEAYTAYRAGTPHREPFVRIEHTGDLIPIERVEPLLCDGRVQAAVCAGLDDPHVLQLGRSQRLFSSAQRRALALRDRGCRAPGCQMPPAWCEAHHILPWEAGGRTDIDNGILLCTYHHHEVHAGRLVIERAAPTPGRWRVVSRLQPLRHRARAARPPATPASDPAAIEVTASTAVLPAEVPVAAAEATAERITPAPLAAADVPALGARCTPAPFAAAASPVLGARAPDRCRIGPPFQRRSRPAAHAPAAAQGSGLERRVRRRLACRQDRTQRFARFDIRPPPQLVLRI